MNTSSKQLVTGALRGEAGPRVPSGPLAVHFCARVAGVSLREYTSDARVLADSVIRYYERFRPDAVWLSADTWVNAQAMGAIVGPADDDQPWGGLGASLVQTARDIERIPPPDVGTQGRYPLMQEALTRIVAALGKEVFVVTCFDQYPFSLAAQLMGINEIMLKLTDDPPMVEALMHRGVEYALAYGRALSDAGADMLSGGDSPAGLIGPRPYREMALPFEQCLIRELKAATGKPVSLHICGNALPILPDMAASGADVLEIDHKTDLRRACEIAGPDIALWGNLDPVGVLAQGTPAQVGQATREALDTAAACGHRRFVLSSGCTLPVETPFENLEAMLSAARTSALPTSE
ncbi:MAG: uroporphyrinogen decarboxylase family protein [Verrucomicrobia bacterium]|nr:uroporphyrinogen decarboxylase family protein [Verrucomicrobiota bacterium]